MTGSVPAPNPGSIIKKRKKVAEQGTPKFKKISLRPLHTSKKLKK